MTDSFIPHEFALCEHFGKKKVRTPGNDWSGPALHYVRMVRSSKIARKPHRPGWYVREWLAHKGLKQADVVERTPFNKGQVSEYVNGTRRWNQDVLEQFAHAIGVDPADLLRPPGNVENELSSYVMAMDEKRQFRALKVLKALADEDRGDKDKVA